MEAGTKLGHYEILDRLGAGGMGGVYRARDMTLDRDVAIKVLPEDFAEDAERLARFEREAKVLASLNHTNIATVFGFDESDGVRFIAMELVDGDGLADRIKSSGRIKVDEALEFARQIALALEAAHEAGVIHRDLKPANVQLAPDGTAKVLDFGIAKVNESSAPADLSDSPTAMIPTETGVIMGTAPYMSPEQTRGHAVDRRTDIWAFGCVLYEMLTGEAAFGGESVSDVVAAIIEREPAFGALPERVSPAVRKLPAEDRARAPARYRRCAHRARGCARHSGHLTPVAHDYPAARRDERRRPLGRSWRSAHHLDKGNLEPNVATRAPGARTGSVAHRGSLIGLCPPAA